MVVDHSSLSSNSKVDLSIDVPPRELRFQVNGMQFAAQEWGESGQLPVLALHGWLDNCASFFALAPRLRDIHLVALDMAGHGQSDHRPGVSSYTLWDEINDIFAVADYLGWNDFLLLAHSRGAIISMLAAGTFPARIRGLMLIEGILPEPARIEDAPQQLANSIIGVRAQLKKPLSIYPSIEHAIKARERGMFPLSYEAAKALTLRGVRAQGDGYSWSTDPRLLAPSAVKVSLLHIQAFMSRITAPIQLLLATDGLPKLYEKYIESVQAYPCINFIVIEGGHHLHMEAQASLVAEKVQSFFMPFIDAHASQ